MWKSRASWRVMGGLHAIAAWGLRVKGLYYGTLGAFQCLCGLRTGDPGPFVTLRK